MSKYIQPIAHGIFLACIPSLMYIYLTQQPTPKLLCLVLGIFFLMAICGFFALLSYKEPKYHDISNLPSTF